MLKNNKKLIEGKTLLLLDFDGVVVPGPNRKELDEFINRSASIISEHKKIPIDAAQTLLNEQMIKNNIKKRRLICTHNNHINLM